VPILPITVVTKLAVMESMSNVANYGCYKIWQQLKACQMLPITVVSRNGRKLKKRMDIAKNGNKLKHILVLNNTPLYKGEQMNY
jgi:hypothetical protein